MYLKSNRLILNHSSRHNLSKVTTHIEKMFRTFDGKSVKTPINLCNSHGKTLQFLNPANLSSLHKQAVLIHPEWLNGLKVAYNKSIGKDKNIFGDFGVSSTGLNSAQIGCNYTINNDNDLVRKTSTIQFSLNPYEKLAKLYICYRPFASLRLRFNNQISAPRIYDGQFRDAQFSSTISSQSACNVDWFGKFSRLSFSAFTLKNSMAASLSLLMKASSNFVFGAEINCKKNFNQEKILIEPCIATAYGNEQFKLVSSIWPRKKKIDLSYFQRFNKHFQAGSIVLLDLNTKTSMGSLFCEYEVGDSILRAKIDSNGLTGVTYEIKLWNFNIINSIVANATTKKIIYGMKIGFDI